MMEWLVWFVLAGILVIFEIFTGTFYLLMIGLGFAAGGLAALSGANTAAQLIVAAIVGAGSTYALRKSKIGRFHKTDAARDPNVNIDIGAILTIEHWNDIENGMATARVMYRGAMWDVLLAHGGTAKPGRFIIQEMRGSRLVVSNHH